MDVGVTPRIAPAREVRAIIAGSMIGADARIPSRLNEIVLRPHQRAAAARLVSLIGTYGGAMLAEPVGLGKTFTALAAANVVNERLLIAVPASLRSMWHAALERTRIAAEIITHEALSRAQRP